MEIFRNVLFSFKFQMDFKNELDILDLACLVDALKFNYASPPSVTGEVYYFTRRQLIFSLIGESILSFERSLRVHSEIDSVCLSVPRYSNEQRDLIFILNLSHYTSMDSSERAQETNGKLFSNFVFVFEILAENRKFSPKTEKYSKEQRGVNIDQIAMFYILMDWSQRALQTNEKLYQNFKLVFEILAKKRKIFK